MCVVENEVLRARLKRNKELAMDILLMIQSPSLMDTRLIQEKLNEIIKGSGEVMEIEPKNGTDFKLDELHEHLQCSLVEVINLNQDDIMVVDEEGKLASNNIINVNATVLAQENQAITSWDYIAGNAIVCNRKMIR